MINKKKVVNYVKNKNAKLSNQKVDGFNIIFKDPFVEDIDYKNIFQHISGVLPEEYASNIDIIYVGEFDYFDERKINSLYLDGAIYVSNIQDNEEDLLDDIVHEIAHSVEKYYAEDIYADGKIEKSFLHKRDILERDLRHYGYDTTKYDFNEIEFNKELDSFLYEEVGYDKLNTFIQGLFISEYSATSLKEYFATGFEEYYIKDRVYLKDISPYIYDKLASLEEKLEGEKNEIYI